MNIPDFVSQLPIPQYGVIYVYGHVSDVQKDMVERIVHRSNFTVEFADADRDDYVVIARRLNLVNLGNEARQILTSPSLEDWDIARFMRELGDINEPTKGDLTTGLPPARRQINHASFECCTARADDDEFAEVRAEAIIKPPKPKKKDSILKRLFTKKKDDTEDRYNLMIADELVLEPDTEADSIERQRSEELDQIRKLILAYVAKYHADPTTALAEVIKGKIVLNPDGMSRVVVNGDARIVLPDYDETEIVMSARERTLYIFFLLHPEGIRQVDIGDYKDQLLDIYSVVKPGASDRTAMTTIGNLCDPFSGSLVQTISKIKAAVNYAVRDKDMASHYIIDGDRGGEYRIDIPRDKVTIPAAFT